MAHFICTCVDLIILGAIIVTLVMITIICILRELEARLEKQRATREYVQEFLKKKEEVIFTLTYDQEFIMQEGRRVSNAPYTCTCIRLEIRIKSVQT